MGHRKRIGFGPIRKFGADGRSIEKANNGWTVSVAAENSIPQDLTRRQS